jgi:hypothetical protein
MTETKLKFCMMATVDNKGLTGYSAGLVGSKEYRRRSNLHFFLISSAVSSSLERLVVAKTTEAPSAAKAGDIALPIPLPPPVTIATLSCSLIMPYLLNRSSENSL